MSYIICIINEIWSAVWKAIVFFGFVYFFILFIRIHYNERKILFLYRQRDKKIAEIKTRAVAQSVIDGIIKKEELDFQSEISSLERYRKYDLEKIPFLKS